MLELKEEEKQLKDIWEEEKNLTEKINKKKQEQILHMF